MEKINRHQHYFFFHTGIHVERKTCFYNHSLDRGQKTGGGLRDKEIIERERDNRQTERRRQHTEREGGGRLAGRVRESIRQREGSRQTDRKRK